MLDVVKLVGVHHLIMRLLVIERLCHVEFLLTGSLLLLILVVVKVLGLDPFDKLLNRVVLLGCLITPIFTSFLA